MIGHIRGYSGIFIQIDQMTLQLKIKFWQSVVGGCHLLELIMKFPPLVTINDPLRSAPISRKNSSVQPETLEALRTNMSQSELLSVVKKSVLRRWRTAVRVLCCRCWDTEPLQRPDFSTLRHAVTKLNE